MGSGDIGFGYGDNDYSVKSERERVEPDLAFGKYDLRLNETVFYQTTNGNYEEVIHNPSDNSSLEPVVNLRCESGHFYTYWLGTVCNWVHPKRSHPRFGSSHAVWSEWSARWQGEWRLATCEKNRIIQTIRLVAEEAFSEEEKTAIAWEVIGYLRRIKKNNKYVPSALYGLCKEALSYLPPHPEAEWFRRSLWRSPDPSEWLHSEWTQEMEQRTYR
jgi:hypothetical protein